MKSSPHLRTATFILAALAFAALAAPVYAQSPLGIGTAERSIDVGGPFAPVLQWINTQQQSFYRSLTGALKAMRDDGAKVWLLIGLSFAYGVFHAAGPGHGKAVISSYMLANEIALKRGVALSFAAGLMQALTAIVVVSLVFLFLHGTSISMTDTTYMLEVGSFALITAFGAWLVWKKVRQMVPVGSSVEHGHSLAFEAAHAHHGTGHAHHDHHHGHDHHGHHHGASCSCGHSHAPDPALLAGDRLDWKTGWSAVVAVGLRPCSGALIVLTFAFLNKLWLGGIASVFAMAVGTAITVSLLATLAVVAKNRAVAMTNGGKWGNRIHHGIELAGALFVLVLGLLLLAATLSA